MDYQGVLLHRCVPSRCSYCGQLACAYTTVHISTAEMESYSWFLRACCESATTTTVTTTTTTITTTSIQRSTLSTPPAYYFVLYVGREFYSYYKGIVAW
jgi:hypothetical protein